MNEINTTSAVDTELDDDWGIEITDEDIAGASDDGEENNSEAAENGNADQQTEENAEQKEQETETSGQAEADQFVLKHLGEERTVNREEVITLAQKGVDYDRIRGKYDELTTENTSLKERMADYEQTKDRLGYFEELAQASGVTIDELIIQTMAAQAASKNNTSVAEEVPKARLAMERKALEKEKANWAKAKGAERSAADEAADAEARVNADIERFMAEFPEAAKDIKNNVPQEVWDAVNANNSTLTEEYRKYVDKQKDAEIERLRTQLEQKEQNEKNKSRSTGSQDSDSVSQTGDIWEDAWNNE